MYLRLLEYVHRNPRVILPIHSPFAITPTVLKDITYATFAITFTMEVMAYIGTSFSDAKNSKFKHVNLWFLLTRWGKHVQLWFYAQGR